jgi:hypothetical protein
MHICSIDVIRWDGNLGLRRALRVQAIDVLEAQEIEWTGNEEGRIIFSAQHGSHRQGRHGTTSLSQHTLGRTPA